MLLWSGHNDKTKFVRGALWSYNTGIYLGTQIPRLVEVQNFVFVIFIQIPKPRLDIFTKF